MIRMIRSTSGRAVALFLCVSLMAPILASCGTGGGTTPPDDNGNGDQSGVTVTRPDANTAVGTAATGNVLAATTVGDANAYSGGFDIQVQSGLARQVDPYGLLIVGSTGGFTNDGLEGVTIVLKTPNGSEIGRITNGVPSHPNGITEFPAPDEATEQRLEAYVQTTIGVQPTKSLDENFRAIIDYAVNPMRPAPDFETSTAASTYWDQIKAAKNAVVRGNENAAPLLVISNPEDGTWTVEVTSPAGTQAYGVGGMYVPAGANIADVAAIEKALPVLAGVSALQSVDSAECQEVLGSASMNLLGDLMSFLPFPYTPRGYVIWAISSLMGIGFIVGAASSVLGLLLGFGVSKAIGYAFDQYGWTDSVQTQINTWLTRWLDGSVAGIKLLVPNPPGMYNNADQIVSVGPSRTFRVYRIMANNCGETPYASAQAEGTTTWTISGNANLGSITDTAEDGSYVDVQTTSSTGSQGNFYVDCHFTSTDGSVDVTSQLRCVFLLI